MGPLLATIAAEADAAVQRAVRLRADLQAARQAITDAGALCRLSWPAKSAFSDPLPMLDPKPEDIAVWRATLDALLAGPQP
jgi:hypothetical protein